MVEWFAGRFGSKIAHYGVIALAAIVMLVMLFALSRCDAWRNRSAVTAQAAQTTASGEAIADAAAVAVDTVVARADADNEIDAATAVALENIGHAENPVDVRNAVIDALCLRDPSRRECPAR